MFFFSFFLYLFIFLSFLTYSSDDVLHSAMKSSLAMYFLIS